MQRQMNLAPQSRLTITDPFVPGLNLDTSRLQKNLRSLDDDTLIESFDVVVRQDRENLARFLYHLLEVQRRRLFSSMKKQSLFDFVVERYGYSRDEAYRRLAAMRLLKDLPEVEETIHSGEICLTNLSLAQTHFEREKRSLQKQLPKEEKISLLREISGKSTRDAKKIIFSRSSNPPPATPDRIQPINDDRSDYQFSGPAAMERKIQQLKGMLAHKYPNISLGDLFDQLCDLGLHEWNPGKVVAPRKIQRIQNLEPSKAEIRRQIFRKAENECEQCGSPYAPQTDHIIAKGKGGLDLPENFRLLCRNCNQREAILDFGLKKMSPYINASREP